jgi:subtilisin family serine protease
MPFGNVIVGLSRTEHITITNTDPTYGLIVTDISLGGGYFEDFNDGLAQGWEPTVPSQWVVVAGEYQAWDTSQTYRMQSTYTGQTWADCACQATFRRTGSMFNVARVVVRATDNFNCQNSTGSAYAAGIAGDGQYWVGKYVNGVFTFLQPWTSSPYLNTGETPNVVLLNIAGNAISVYLNGNLAWNGTDNDITAPGRIGLVPYTASGDSTTHYSDDVQVADPLTEGTVKIGDEQAWYNAHPFNGYATPEQSPQGDISPPAYPGGQEDSTPGSIGALSGSRGGFRIENLPALPAVIPPLGSVTFDVVFEPNLIGEYLSSAVIKSNDVDEPEVAVQLGGTGIPDYMEVTPDANFTFSGHPGGPFLPSYAYYYLKNLGPAQIDWMLTCPDWLNANITSGAIKPLETVKISVTPNALARSKPRGIYTGQLVFKNLTTTAEHDCNVSLNIYTDPKIWFTPGSVDANVCYGGSRDKILTIGNGGDGLLNFTLAGRQTGFTPVSMPVTIAGEPAIETQKDVAALAPPKHSFTALAGNTDFAEGQILVRFAPQPGRTWPGSAEKNSILANAGNGKLAAARVTKEYNIVRGLSLVKLPGDVAVKDALVTLNNTPGVLYAEPDYKLKVMSAPQIVPNDPRFSELWGLNNTGQSGGTPDADIDAPEAWDIATGTNEIIVAVIDTGVDYTHPDLASNMWVNTAELNGIAGVDDDGNGYIDDIYGYDFCNNDGNPMDDHYHGTHCAGTIGAIGNNGQGVAGVCWNVKIMALKFLDAGGSGYTDDAIECVQYAVLMGAKLSSNSWGGGSYSQALKDAIDAAGNANQLFIAAAGNDYGNNNDINPAYPSSYTSENIIAVMATDKYDSMSGFSNYGPTSVDIGAPGTDILSCQPGSSYQYLSGTSMATPHVSGAAALIWSVYPSMSYQEVKNILLQTVDEIPSLSGKCVSEGRLNLFNAVNEVGVFWMEFLPSSGSVDGGQTNNVTVKFHGDVPVGNYQGLITITSNDPYTRDINVPVTMTVRPLDYFTELFGSGDNDLDNHTLTLVPDNSVQFYTACLEDASGFPVDPAGGTVLTLNDDDYYEVQLQGSVVSLYGTSYDALYIGSNGYITFVSGDTHYFEQFSDHFALPRIAALFDDLNPAAGGTISYKQLADRIAVTFENVPEFSLNNDNTFQIEMFFDGRIRITWLRIDAQDGLVGLSAGNGLPDYFVERDISKYGPCICSNSPDLDHDGNVDWFDIVIFADHWLDIGCGPVNLCCGGCDFKGNGSVNFDDFDYIADSWLSAQ